MGVGAVHQLIHYPADLGIVVVDLPWVIPAVLLKVDDFI